MPIHRLIPVGASLLLAPAILCAQQPSAKVPVKESTPGLAAKARISGDSAEAIALARVPGGTIKEAEIEVERHRLIYSFDVKVAGQEGITEVNVDARTGAVVGVSHEGPADEAREKAKEKRDRSKHRRAEKGDTAGHR